MKNIILHIPHSSIRIPSYEGYLLGKSMLDAEILKLTDWYVDELFYSESDLMVVADFSRIFCDVERFADDKEEIMSQFGMGAMYEKTDNGDLMRELTSDQKKIILKEYYWKHHERLNNAVNTQLSNHSLAVIIDCHSFSNTPFNRDLDQTSKRPDFNIGTDKYHTPKSLVDFTTRYFEENGYTVGVDYPYSGTIVPMNYYKKDSRVESIMVEINRKLYLKGATNEKSEKFLAVKNAIDGYLERVKLHI